MNGYLRFLSTGAFEGFIVGLVVAFPAFIFSWLVVMILGLNEVHRLYAIVPFASLFGSIGLMTVIGYVFNKIGVGR